MNAQRPPSRIVLAGYDGKPDERRWEHNSVLRIGSEKGLEVVIDDPAVSPHHATLSITERGWMLEDAHSAAGTFLNGLPATKMEKVSLGDVIHCGAYGLKVTYLEEPTVCIRCPSPARNNGDAAPAPGMKVEAVTHRSWEEGLQDLSARSELVNHGNHLFTLLRAGYHPSA